MRISAETKGFQKLFNAYRKQPNTIAKLTIVETAMTLRRMAESVKIRWAPHKKTGQLENEQFRDVIARNTVIIGKQFATAPHAPFVEFKTRPHVIRARKASALRFRTGQGIVFAKKVNHPGTAAIPAYREAMLRHGRGFNRRLAGRVKAKFR